MCRTPPLLPLKLEAFNRAWGWLGNQQLEGIQKPEDAEDSDQAAQPRCLPVLEALHRSEANAGFCSEVNLGEIAFQSGPCKPPPEFSEHRLVCKFRTNLHNASFMRCCANN